MLCSWDVFVRLKCPLEAEIIAGYRKHLYQGVCVLWRAVCGALVVCVWYVRGGVYVCGV